MASFPEMRAPISQSPTHTTPALERALQQWDRMIELLPVGIYVCDSQGFLVRYNRRAAELWGQAPPSTEPYKVYRADGEPIERPDGTRVTILADLEPLFDESGELIGGVNCFQDITPQKLAEALLSESERRHRDILEALPAAVYTTDSRGHLTYYNRAAAELWGFAPALGMQWCGSHRLYWTSGAPMPHEDCPMAEAIQTEQALTQREALPNGRTARACPSSLIQPRCAARTGN